MTLTKLAVMGNFFHSDVQFDMQSSRKLLIYFYHLLAVQTGQLITYWLSDVTNTCMVLTTVVGGVVLSLCKNRLDHAEEHAEFGLCPQKLYKEQINRQMDRFAFV